MTSFKCLVAGVLAAASAMIVGGAAANAAIIEVRLTDDQRLFDYEATAGDTTVPSQGSSNNLRTGTTVVNARQASTILPFPLPVIPEGEEISTAFLTVNSAVQNSANVPLTPNADLYGLPFDEETDGVEITSTRHYTGALDPAASPTGTTRLLQDNFLTPALAPSSGSDITVTSVDVSSYLTSLYQGGADDGDFAVFRLSYDSTDSSELRRYAIRSAGGTGAAANAETRPLLTITTVPAIPEPGTLGLAAVAALGLLGRRRRMI